jgi:hypothetical protein
VVFFILFLATPAFIPLVMLLPISDGAKAIVSAILALGLPELFAVLAIAIMGRENFDRLLAPILRFIRRVSPPTVSRRRYLIGLGFFLVPLLEAFLFLHVREWRDLFENHTLVRAIVWNVMFWSSFLILGGDFRMKIVSLFTRTEPPSLGKSEQIQSEEPRPSGSGMKVSALRSHQQ